MSATFYAWDGLITQMLDLYVFLAPEGVFHKKAALHQWTEMTDRHARGGRAAV